MQSKKEPVTGTALIQEQISKIISHIAQVQEVVTCEITKLTIVVQGRNGREHLSKVFAFPPGTIPGEFKDFMVAYCVDMAREAEALRSTIKLIKVNNEVLAMDDFIKDYTAGRIPSMDADDSHTINSLEIGANCIVKVNGTMVQVQRIN